MVKYDDSCALLVLFDVSCCIQAVMVCIVYALLHGYLQVHLLDATVCLTTQHPVVSPASIALLENALLAPHFMPTG